MKICNNCNATFEDNVNFCSVCGAKLEEAPAPAPVTPAPEAPAPKKSVAPVILGFISNVASVLSVFFALCAIALPYIRVSVSLSKYSSSGISAHAYIYHEEALAVFAFLFSMAALVLAIISGIMVFTKRPCIEKLFATIAKLVMNFFLFVFGIILLANI